MSEKFVAGIYFERTGGTLLVAKIRHHQVSDIRRPWPRLEFVEHDTWAWQPSDAPAAEAKIRSVAEELKNRWSTRLSRIGVASYGPFSSLNRASGRCGQLHQDKSHMPLRGFDLPGILSHGFGSDMRDFVTIQTDANALTLGEAFARDTPKDHLLVGILVTEGIGAGIVTGRKIFSSALHPEIGLIHTRVAPHDLLKPDTAHSHYSKSLADLADNASMAYRYAVKNEVSEVTSSMLRTCQDDEIWEQRAYYIAQAALACTALLAPHKIVVFADIDPAGNLAERTQAKVARLLKIREGEGAPVFEYDELLEKDFISAPYSFRPVEAVEPAIGVTGAAGICVAAALDSKGTS